MLTVDQASKLMGRVALFIGTYSRGWTDQQFAAAAQNAHAMGVDTLIYKVVDGGIAWYAPDRITSIRKAIMDAGCGALPFQYLYGMKYGAAQIPAEANLLLKTQEASDGLVCADMEVEWDGQAAAAETLAKLVGGHGTFLVSTWADPNQQNWGGVTEALLPVTDIWMPQQYSRWLATQTGQLFALGEHVIQPTFDLSGEFDAGNDPLQEATNAYRNEKMPAISLWELSFAQKNPNLTRSIAAVMGNSLTSAAPVKLPTPAPKPTSPVTGQPVVRAKTYVVKAGDTLSGIAQKLGDGANWFYDLYLPNKTAIEAAAKAHGQASSHNGSLIYPGTPLSYRA